MRFLLDENAPLRLTGHLQALGHDVRSIAQDYQSALDDRVVLQIARRERRILVTGDRDFGELIFRRHLPHAGVLYFRLRNTQLPVWIARFEVVLRDHADHLHLYLVVTEGDVRLRTPGEEWAR